MEDGSRVFPTQVTEKWDFSLDFSNYWCIATQNNQFINDHGICVMEIFDNVQSLSLQLLQGV